MSSIAYQSRESKQGEFETIFVRVQDFCKICATIRIYKNYFFDSCAEMLQKVLAPMTNVNAAC
jgi:hypothetical protein